MMNMKNNHKPLRRLPAEWEPVQAVMIAWPHKDTDWNYMLEEVERCYVNLAESISDHAELIVIGPSFAIERAKALLTFQPLNKIHFYEVQTNDTWTRDYGAITIESESEKKIPLDFKFNGWGLKFAACFDNLVTSHCSFFNFRPENHLSFVLEGGSIESDGKGTILTTSECLLSLNRNGGMSKPEIEEYIKSSLGAERIIWLDNGALKGDDTDSHIDTLARLAPPGDVIFYTGCNDPDDEHYLSLKAMAEELKNIETSEGRPYTLIELPLPDPIYDPEDGSRLPATYANFLIVNDAVLLPVYGQPLKDRQAIDTLSVAMPDYTIVPVDCRALIRQHGSLHCATMQFPINSLKL